MIECVKQYKCIGGILDGSKHPDINGHELRVAKVTKLYAASPCITLTPAIDDYEVYRRYKYGSQKDEWVWITGYSTALNLVKKLVDGYKEA